jgi:hypothetical protein
MNASFAKYMRRFVLVFMDDILIFTKTLEDHVEHLQIVFQTLQENKHFIKFSKCTFAQQEISYLGHVISQEGVSTDPTKTEAMIKWHVPQNFTDLRGFLGLTGYYRKYVKNYGIIAKPLTHLLQNKTFSWNQAAQVAFDKLKLAMTSTHVLSFPDFSKVFIIEIDACDTGIGAVLIQEGHHIAYFSKGLSIANQRLSTYEKEFMAVMMVVDKWTSYLHRNDFIIQTDHQSLCHL